MQNSVYLVTDKQAVACVKHPNSPVFSFVKHLSNIMDTTIIPRDQRDFLPDEAPVGYHWLVLPEGAFPEITQALNSCEE